MKASVLILALILIFSSVLIAAPAISAAAAQSELGKWWKDSEVVQKLQLSEAQVQKIEQAFLQFRPALAGLNSELKSRETELSSLMSANAIDEARIKSQTELIAVSRAALEKSNSAMMLAMRKELSKEQWDRLQKIRELRQDSVSLAAGVPTVPSPPTRITKTKDGESVEQIYTVGGPVQAPKALYHPLPAYTQEARDAKIEGIVLLQGIVRKNGRITDLKLVKGLGYGLDQNASNAISNEWRFDPGTLEGQPVDVQVTLEISFRRY
jgi:TonB family protein